MTTLYDINWESFDDIYIASDRFEDEGMYDIAAILRTIYERKYRPSKFSNVYEWWLYCPMINKGDGLVESKYWIHITDKPFMADYPTLEAAYIALVAAILKTDYHK